MTDQEPKRTADGIFNVTLVCRLVADPELRYTPSGTAVCNMRTAVNLRVQENGDWAIKTVWVRVTAWGKQAETCAKWLTKGSKIFATSNNRPGFDHESGNPPTFKRQDGTYGASFEFTADQIVFLGGGARNEPVEAEETVIPF
jgi:single-strand DNA-binding protein